MSLDANLKIQALDESGNQMFMYEPEFPGYGIIHKILRAEEEVFKDRLLGMVTDEELEYFKFFSPDGDEYIPDISTVEPKDPTKILSVLERYSEHYRNYEMKAEYKKDIAEGDDNWRLSKIRQKIRLLEDLGKIMGIMELAKMNGWKVRNYLYVY